MAKKKKISGQRKLGKTALNPALKVGKYKRHVVKM